MIHVTCTGSRDVHSTVYTSDFQIGFVQSRSFYGSPEEFMSMGDIDWGKRSIGSTLGKRNVGSALRAYRSPYKRYESPGKMDAG